MSEVSVTFLGGVGSFGKNAAIFECDGFKLGIDCGVRFVKEETHQLEICDLFYLNQVDEFVATHGHEDHIGGLPYLEQNKTVVHATAFTQRMLGNRMRRRPDFRLLGPPTKIGPFTVEAINVQHSIPQSTALLIDSPAGLFVWTGDFRIGERPLLGEQTDLKRLLEKTSERPALALFSDSTGSNIEGTNPGDRIVVDPLAKAFSATSGAVVVATFASHLERLVALGKACEKSGRKLFVMGRSLENNVHRANDCGILLPKIEPLKMLSSTLREKQVLVVTGTQGEERSAAGRISRSEDRRMEFRKGDAFVHSARVIPGNREEVETLFERIRERDVTVYTGDEDRHVSGHGMRGDLEEMMVHTAAKYFCAVHGSERHLEAHRELAEGLGATKQDVLDVRNGDRLFFKDNALYNRDRVPFGDYGIVDGEAQPLTTIELSKATLPA